jgi:hypothetical protein
MNTPGEDPEASEPDPSQDDLLPARAYQNGDESTSQNENTAQNESTSEEVEEIVSLVFARIENKLEQHLHTQMELPDPDQAADLREKAPEIYNLWIEIARKKAETESYIQSAQYEVPARLARTGRPWALGALVLVLVFCAYLATFGGGAVYIAGIVAAVDLVSMLGLFLGFRPELAADPRRANAKALPRPENEPPRQDPDDPKHLRIELR